MKICYRKTDIIERIATLSQRTIKNCQFLRAELESKSKRKILNFVMKTWISILTLVKVEVKCSTW